MKTFWLLALVAVCVAGQPEAPLKVIVEESDGQWTFVNLTLPLGSPSASVVLRATDRPTVLLCPIVPRNTSGCAAPWCYWFDLTYALPDGAGFLSRMTSSIGNQVGSRLTLSGKKGARWWRGQG